MASHSPPPKKVRERLGSPWILSLGGLLIRLLAGALDATLRVRVVGGDEHISAVLESGRPAIFAFWHNRQVVCAYRLLRRLAAHGRPLAILVSLSRDGELAAQAGQRMGLKVVRGSTSRGGFQGLRRLHRVIAKDGVSVMLAPDGPRGPVYRCQQGTIVLAQTTGAPIIPMAYVADRSWRLGSWDKLFVPKPFARVALVIGEPLPVPRQLDRAQAEAMAVAVKDRLDSLVEVAASAVTAS